MAMRTEINLTFHRTDFEAIFFQNRQDSYIHSPTTKKAFRDLLIVSLSLLIVLAGWYWTRQLGYVVILLGFVFWFYLYSYWRNARALWQWKKQIKAFLDKHDAVQTHQLILTDEAFSMIQDGNQTIERWSELKRADLTDTYIRLEAGELYFFPRKAFTGEQFDEVKQMIAEKMHQP
ncbi:MAG: YcxB family protein [Bacteroidetes bacterium]|nr:MAG: YcxB family protein [Bacteroidota bacterium]